MQLVFAQNNVFLPPLPRSNASGADQADPAHEHLVQHILGTLHPKERECASVQPKNFNYKPCLVCIAKITIQHSSCHTPFIPCSFDRLGAYSRH